MTTLQVIPESFIPVIEPSSTSSNNANPIPTRPSSPSSKEQDRPPTPIPSARRGTTSQATQPDGEIAAIRHAFSSQQTATDFMSAYGRSTGLSSRVHNIGARIDAFAVARDEYTRLKQQMDTDIQYLVRHMPRGPYLDDLFRRMHSIEPTRPVKPPHTGQPTANRPPPSVISSSPSREATPPVPAVQPQQPSQVVSSHSTLPTPPTTPPRGNAPASTPRSPFTPRRRDGTCSLCSRVGHQPSQCEVYYCLHCDTNAPGHFAKYCPENPYRGLARRDIPTEDLAKLERAEALVRQANQPTHIPKSIPGRTSVQPPLSGLSTRDANHPGTSTAVPEQPSARTTTTLGPTYRPVHTPRRGTRPAPRGRNYGRLQTSLSTPNRHPRRSFPDYRQTNGYSTYQRPQSPIYDDGNNEFDYDDVALYNMTGEGRID